VPVYFAEGRPDANALPFLVERYLQVLQVPHKKLAQFERSAHNLCFEKADQLNRFMVTVLAINGIRQGMFIESQNTSNPVLLVVHSGPGMPDHFLPERYPTDLDELFTVASWEQRGTGLSYGAQTFHPRP
jgi:pimeloyl-ACP methyl ester carboxylesterase